jgi:hypothetical protein
MKQRERLKTRMLSLPAAERRTFPLSRREKGEGNWFFPRDAQRGGDEAQCSAVILL